MVIMRIRLTVIVMRRTAWQCTRRQPGVARVKFRARRAAGNKVTLGKTSSASASLSSSNFPLKSVIINPQSEQLVDFDQKEQIKDSVYSK